MSPSTHGARATWGRARRDASWHSAEPAAPRQMPETTKMTGQHWSVSVHSQSALLNLRQGLVWSPQRSN